jgi:hypothetical protein
MFPTIPTTADGRLAGLNQLNTTATLTGPNLNTLTGRAAGDLVIAVAGEYQSNAGADAAFTGWAGGGLSWTEIRDSTGTANGRLGVAYARLVTGSETGAVTVTRSGTLVGDASMIIMCIPGAHASTAPEASAAVHATAAAADVGAFDPAGWDAEDTLWIGVSGNGMTATGGSWTANNSAPANYTDYFGTNPSDTNTIGDFGLAVAFRQNNAASEDMGTFSQDTSNARSSALVIAVRPAPSTTPTLADAGAAADSLAVDTGAVTFDAVGPSAAGAGQTGSTSPFTWSHTCSGTDRLLLVGVGIGSSNDGSITTTATYNGVSMTSLAKRHSNDQSSGYAELFALVNPDSGTNTVSITLSGSNIEGIEGGSVSFKRASGTAGVTSAVGTATPAQVTVSSAAGNMVADLVVCGFALAGHNQTSRWVNNRNTVSAGGNAGMATADGASSVTMTRTHDSDWWVSIGVEIQVAVGEAAKTLADQGAAADSLPVVATAWLADQAVATDALAVATQTPLADAGTAAQALAVDQTAPATLPDAGTAAEAAVVAAQAPLAEVGQATDDLTVDQGVTAKTLSDAGTATEGLQATAVGPTRAFNGSSYIILDEGTAGLATVPTGAATYAMLARRADDGDWDTFLSLETSANSAQGGLQIRDSDLLVWLGRTTGGVADANSTGAVAAPASDGWCVYAVTKPNGNATVRGHKVVIATGVPTHTNDSQMGNGLSVSGGRVQVGRWQSSDLLDGWVALGACWDKALSDGEVESLAVGLQAWLDTDPVALWLFTQVSVATAVTDEIGDADQASITGTTVDPNEGPAPFDWSTSGPTAKTLAEAGSAADGLAVAATVPLAQPGAAAEALTTAAALALAQAGAAADQATVDQGTTPKTLSDAGAASGGYSDGYGTFLPPEQLAIAAATILAADGAATDALVVDQGVTAKTLGDSGTGTDSPAAAAATSLPDAGSGADRLQVAAQATLAEQTGATADALSVVATAARTLADAGQAADAVTTTAALTLAQAGAAVTDLSTDQAAQKALADQGQAAERLAITAPVALADQGQAADVATTAAALTLAQAGAAADSATIQAGDAKTVTEPATGTDTLRVAATTPLADQGQAAEQLVPSQTKTLADSGSAAQTLGVDQTQAKTLAELGSGADSLRVAAATLLAEVAAAADLATIAATLELAEGASGGDSLYLPPEAIPGDGHAWAGAPAGTAYADRVAAPGTAYADKTLGKVSVG